MRYSAEPTNGLTTSAVDQRVRGLIQSQGLYGLYAPRSIPQLALDVPIVTELPKIAQDGAEVNLRVGDGADRYLYLRSLPGWRRLNDTVNQSILTTLPTDAEEGDQIVFDTGAAGVRWQLVYDTSDGTTYPWLFIGGPPLTAEVATSQSTTSTAYVDLATVGPSLTLPLAGDYIFAHSHSANTSTLNEFGLASVKLGAAPAADLNAAWHSSYGTSNQTAARPAFRRDGLAAAAVCKLVYRTVGGATVNFENRVLSITPVRVG